MVRESLSFYKEWPCIEASIQLLLRWRKILVDESKEWLTSYLMMFNAFIKLGVNFEDLNALEFSILNFKKTSKMKLSFELPPNVSEDNSKEVPEVIMVTWKK